MNNFVGCEITELSIDEQTNIHGGSVLGAMLLVGLIGVGAAFLVGLYTGYEQAKEQNN